MLILSILLKGKTLIFFKTPKLNRGWRKQSAEQKKHSACQIPADMPYVEDNTHCKLKMFWQQILQLGDAFVDSVTSFLLDESVGQLVCFLQKGSNVVSEIQAL